MQYQRRLITYLFAGGNNSTIKIIHYFQDLKKKWTYLYAKNSPCSPLYPAFHKFSLIYCSETDTSVVPESQQNPRQFAKPRRGENPLVPTSPGGQGPVAAGACNGATFLHANFIKGYSKTPPFVLQSSEGEHAPRQASWQVPQASPCAPGYRNLLPYRRGGRPSSARRP